MNVADAIREWVETGGSYARGLALLETRGGCGEVLLEVLRRGEDSYTLKKLTELLATAGPSEGVVCADVADVPSVPARSEMARRELQQQAYALMDERSDLKSRIRAVAEDEARQDDRRTWAFRIKALTRDIDTVYDRLAFLDAYGYLPLDRPDLDTTPADDRAALLNVRTYVSRYKKKVAEAKTDAQRVAAEAKLDEYVAEETRLKLVLGYAVQAG
jgi:hypothetical protein